MANNSKYDPQELARAFGSTAAVYDEGRAKVIPGFKLFYDAAVRLLPFGERDEPRVLDLGAGTGLLSAWVMACYPGAHLTLIDLAAEMLDKARERFVGAKHEPVFLLQDYVEGELGGPYDAIVSSLSIHHLDDESKKKLFARAYAALEPGAIFVNAEQVAGPTPAWEEFYVNTWKAEMRANGVTAEEIAIIEDRQKVDKHVPLAEQMLWLKEAGFEQVDCWFKCGRVAVYSGCKPR